MKRALSRAFKLTAVFSFIMLATALTACKDQSMLFVADPVFNPPFGEVAKGTIVTITCETEDAEIWYTKNGTDPTKGPIDVFRYTGPFTINETTTVKARAVKEGWVPSNVKMAQGTYVVSGTSGVGGGTVTPPKPAVITYEVTMEDDGNGTATATPSSAEAGKNIDISAIPKTGYRFKEWQVISGGAAIKPNLTTEPASFAMPASDVTVKVIFEPVPANTPNLALSDVAFAAITYGDPQPAAKIVTITNTGNVAATVSRIELGGTQKDSFTLDSSITSIAAGAGADFTVRPNAGLNAGTYDNVYITVTYSGGTVTSGTAKADISFTVDKAAGATVGGLPTVNSATASSITVSAVTISPNPGGQDVEYAISTASDGTGLGAWQAGLTFSGVNLNTTTYYVYARSKENTNYAAGTTLTYSVEIFTYAVAYNGNGGTGSMAKQTFVYGLSQRLTKNVFTRAGYTFSGWAETSGGTKAWEDEESVHNLGSTPGATVDLYAAWTPISGIAVTFDANGGTPSPASRTVTFGTAYGSLPSVSKTGYTFVGWYTAATGGTEVTATTIVANVSPHTLYAHWIGISLSQIGTHTFTAATFGYGAQTPLSVNVNNTGNQPTGALTVALSGANPTSFTLSTTSIGSIAVSGSTTGAFTVRPNTGLAVGTYTATVTVSNTGNGITASFNVSFIVNPGTYGISLSQTGTHTFTAATVGYGAQTALSVNVNNTGDQPTGALTVALSGTNPTSFTLSTTSIGSIAVSGSTTGAFTVRPNTGLAAGTYTATVTVSGSNGITASFNVSFTVNVVPTYGISLSQTGTHTFTAATFGYGGQTALSVNVNNTGNQPTGGLNVALSGTNSGSFALSTASIGTIAAGGSNTGAFTVVPDTGLAVGTYTATITVSGSNGITASFNVSFTVNVVPTYSISLSETGTYAFTTETFGYGAQTPLSVNVNNTGNQPTGGLTVALSGTNPTSFTLSTTSISSIVVSGSTTGAFTVVPNTGLAVGTYSATVTVSGSNGITANFDVSFTVNAVPTYSISLSQTGTHTFTTVAAGYGAQTALSINVNNTGNQPTGTLTVALSGTNPTSFTLLTTSISSIAVSGSTTGAFTVEPNTGLAVGTYTATVTVSGSNGITANFDVSFTVNAVPTYGISLSHNDTHGYPQGNSAITFAVANASYVSDPQTPLTITITNTGNQPTGPLTVAKTAGANQANFTLSTTSIGSIAATGVTTATFTVVPDTGLARGFYEATITVSNTGNGISENFRVGFTVYTDQNSSGSYIITPGFSNFIAIKNDTPYTVITPVNSPIAAVIGTDTASPNNAGIRAVAVANPTVQFGIGDGTTALSIGATNAEFNNTGGTWNGTVTVRGKLTSAFGGTASGGLYNRVTMDSYADVVNTGPTHRAVYNTGTLNIKGGTISTTINVALYNAGSGVINISGGTVSATHGTQAYAIYNNSTGAVNITSGTVQGMGNGGIAVSNYSTGKITISGGTVTSANTTTTNGTIWLQTRTVPAANTGLLEIKTGGYVANTASGNAIRNDTTGKITISGGTVTSANTSAVLGTITIGTPDIFSPGADNTTTLRLEMISGTVQNTSTGPTANAIYSNNANATMNITGGTVSTNATGGNYAVNNAGGGSLTIVGTTIIGNNNP